ncbi:MAG: glycosyltransferase family 39 protein [Anaerolineae bacterium]|nr:glycosyltransferase family 39 protein [Anaerolineae bacterium]
MVDGVTHPPAHEKAKHVSYFDLTPRQEWVIVAFVLAAFVALAVGFSLGPILEGPDEIEHYRFVRLLADTWQLPNRMTINHEYHQPPLYYAIAALLKMPIDDPDFDAIEAYLNPAGIVVATFRGPNWRVQPGYDNRNFIIHSRAENFPYQSGAARAVHVVRLLSVVLGLGTLVTCYAVAGLLWPERPDRRLAVLGIVAFWPLFVYTSSYVTNDALLIFLSTLALYLTMRQVRDGPTLRSAVTLGVVLGCALLSKISALMLAAPVGLAILLNWRRAWRFGAITLAVALAIGGWWYVQGAILYNDPTGLRTQYQIIPNSQLRLGEIGFTESLERMEKIYRLLWARFGWLSGNIVVTPTIYMFFDALVCAGVIGALISGIIWLLRKRVKFVNSTYPPMVAVMATMGLVVLVAVYIFAITYRMGTTTARYLLPAIGVWACLLAYGIDFWLPQRYRLLLALSGIVIRGAVTTVCLFGYFLPAYRPLPPPTHIEHPLALRYNDVVELVGVGDTTIYTHPGEVAIIRLYWRAIQPTEDEILIAIRSDEFRQPLMVSTPATGNLRSTEWQSGQTWAEHWQIYIPPDVPPQTVYRFAVKLYDLAKERLLELIDQDSRELHSAVIEIVVLDD